MTGTLSLTEAAEELGVHYMTAYRYVRTGRLVAEKAGGQWVVERDELSRFISPSDTPRRRTESLPPELEARLLAGDETGAMQVAEGALASGADPEELYLEVLVPALESIGSRWADGQITIADEHVATATASRVIGRLGSRFVKRGRTRATVLLAGVPDDFHALPTAILRDLLRARGFEVQDLGANTPIESVIERAESIDGLLAVGIAATNTDNLAEVERALSTAADALDVPIVAGGAAVLALDPSRSLEPCHRTTSARHAIEIFEQLADEA